ncbi:MAG: hypothetical protein GXP55_12940 [Deltaproteobacteria bacterium]|nr:hypothetical protein [Deltaproteobacteria bacterium]
MSGDEASKAGRWRDEEERGNSLVLRITLGLAWLAGRRVTRALLFVVSFYYALFAGSARRATRDFLRRVGEPTGFWRVQRQLFRFSEVALDAVYFLKGETGRFEFSRDGHEHLEALVREGKGALLLGGHIGSFYAMRAASADFEIPVYPLVHTANAKRINALFRAIAPEMAERVIEIDEGDMRFMLRVRELVEQGALVALLADRVPESGHVAEVDFLGGKALLPTGPYLLASTLRCPVFFTAGIYRAPNRYELHCEPFAERVVLKRGARQEAAREYAARYAERLEHYARSAPDNWFNFFQFWVAK